MLSTPLLMTAGFLRETELFVWFYRGLGATVGHNVVLSGNTFGNIMCDFDLIEIGDEAFIDQALASSFFVSSHSDAAALLQHMCGSAVVMSGMMCEDPSSVYSHNLSGAPGVTGILALQGSTLAGHDVQRGMLLLGRCRIGKACIVGACCQVGGMLYTGHVANTYQSALACLLGTPGPACTCQTHPSMPVGHIWHGLYMPDTP